MRTLALLNHCIVVAYEKLCSVVKMGNGAQGRNRTTDTVIFSHVLYQLSYLGIRQVGGAPIEGRRA